MIRWVAGILFLVISGGGPANANFKHGSNGASLCPYPATAVADGCSIANQNGNFLVSTTFSQTFQAHAQTSGQTWTSGHPWAFNAAGVDYPVSYDKTLTLKNPTVGANLPAGAAYDSANDRLYISGTTDVVLNGFDFTVANGDTKTGVQIRDCLTGIAKLTISNSKFKLGTALNTGVSNNAFITTCSLPSAGSIYIINNEFDGSYNTAGGNSFSWVTGVSGQQNIITFNGNALVDFEYNYVHNLSSQVLVGGAGSSNGNAIYTVAHNYIEGFSLQGPRDINGSTPYHGAVLENTSTTSNLDFGSQYEQYNTVVFSSGYGELPITTPFSALNNANNYNQYLDNFNVSNNIIVINCGVSENPCQYNTNTAVFTGSISGSTLTVGTVSSGTIQVGQIVSGGGQTGSCSCTQIIANISGSGNGSTWTVSVPQTVAGGSSLTAKIQHDTVSSAVAEPFGLAKILNFTMNNNWVDVHGAQFCTLSLGSAFNITGFIDDGLGGGSYDSVPGFILTVTGYSGSASAPISIFPYQYIVSSSTSQLLTSVDPTLGYYVMPYGTSGTTGTGGTGTYKLASDSGSAFAANGTGEWKTANVPVGSNQRFGWSISGNTSLIDGGSIYPGGIQWNSTSFGGSCAHTVNNS